MKVPTCFLIAIALAFVTNASSQSSSALTKNNPYSPSPSGKVATSVAAATPMPKPLTAATPTRVAPQQIAFAIKDNRTASREDDSVRAGKPRTIETNSPSIASSNRSATDIYRIGIGDVLFINLTNSPHGSGYYTVREDGMIDYPLAGPKVLIAGRTSDEAVAMLRSAIKLYANPQVEVKIQYYLSRSFFVDGLADNPGGKILRRDAMPLFAIRAESEVKREATTAKITRAASNMVETYLLTDVATDNVLVLDGDKVEFLADKKDAAAFYTFAGVKKPLATGAKLSQAITDNLGVKAEPRRVVLRRTNERGASNIVEHDIKAIRSGKAIDPVLASGDVIEIKN